MKKISAKIVADSIDSRGNRITSFLLTYPRFIHGELMTHRMFSRNSASSRAIPFEKMVKMVEEDPFIPIAWQKNHKGMQGSEYLSTNLKTPASEVNYAKYIWLESRDHAIKLAKELNSDLNVTKQFCNRLLEPFMWHTVLVTATEFENFFKLRCPQYNYLFNFYKSKKDVLKASKDGKYNDGRNFSDFTTEDWLGINSSQAEIHIQALAESMWDAMNESIPNQLEASEWHMPFMGNFNAEKLLELSGGEPEDFELICRKIATARAARLSYITFDGEINYEKDLQLYESLLSSGHMSPFEHVSRCMSDNEYYSFIKGKVPSRQDQWGFFNEEFYPVIFKNGNELEFVSEDKRFGWCNNFRGFIPYRYLIENGIKI